MNNKPKNFEEKIYGDLIKGLVYPNGKVEATRIFNASISGRTNYTIENPSEVDNMNIPESVKLAVKKITSEDYFK
jgi:hypothetical protein